MLRIPLFYHGSYWRVLTECINCTVPTQPAPALRDGLLGSGWEAGIPLQREPLERQSKPHPCSPKGCTACVRRGLSCCTQVLCIEFILPEL